MAVRVPERFLPDAFFVAAALLELFFAPPLRAAVFFEEAVDALLSAVLERADLLPAAFFEPPPFFPPVVAGFELFELLDAPGELLLDRERPRLPLPAPLSDAVSPLTSLLKLLLCPPAVSSW
ncbi:MAG: hypothetical protein ACJ74Z_09620 [Bryobacteraceae bacterium]